MKKWQYRLLGYPVSHIACFGGIWTLLEPLGLTPGFRLWFEVFLGANILYLIGLCIHIHRSQKKDDIIKFSHLSNSATLTDLFFKKQHVRIFASGSETYRNAILPILPACELKNKLCIQILVRDDGTTERMDKILEAKKKWKNDIDNNNNVTTEIRKYTSEVFLRGIISDSEIAALGWYYVSQDGTKGQLYPATIYRKNNPESCETIKFATLTFDEIFKNAPKA